jgi:hypothetical protein
MTIWLLVFYISAGGVPSQPWPVGPYASPAACEAERARVGGDRYTLGGSIGTACVKMKPLGEQPVSVFSAIAMAFVVVGAAVVGWTGLLFHAHNDIGIDGSNVPPPDRDNDGFAAWRSAGSPAAIRSVFVPCQTANGCACPLDWIDGAWECRACGTSDRHHR